MQAASNASTLSTAAGRGFASSLEIPLIEESSEELPTANNQPKTHEIAQQELPGWQVGLIANGVPHLCWLHVRSNHVPQYSECGWFGMCLKSLLHAGDHEGQMRGILPIVGGTAFYRYWRSFTVLHPEAGSLLQHKHPQMRPRLSSHLPCG